MHSGLGIHFPVPGRGCVVSIPYQTSWATMYHPSLHCKPLPFLSNTLVVFYREHLRHIARVWSEYLAQSRIASAASGTAVTANQPCGNSGFQEEGVSPHVVALGVNFGPETEPGPLDSTGRLPNELLESMFDYLDEDMTMNCASVARRWVIQ